MTGSERRNLLEKIKAFGMTNQMLLEDLSRIEKESGTELGHVTQSVSELEERYLPQFDMEVRREAATMGRAYELFYCLEKSIRKLVSESLAASTGREDWWEASVVPSHIKVEVHNRIKAEIDAGVTRRSLDALDYTTFGELANIITANWEFFGGPLNSKKAVEKVMSNLNSLRNPIAHCSLLAEDEEFRLSLALRDWFRLME